MSTVPKEQREAQLLHLEWQRGRARMWTELIAKFAHYQQLPYKLLQLAHHDSMQVVVGAQCCLLLWKQQGAGCSHRQTRRFLDPSFDGGPHDPSLQPLVQRLAQGEHLFSSQDFLPIIKWLSRFQCVRLAERPVEGVHSHLTRTLRRAPHGDIPYLSVEVRFAGFWSCMIHDPQVACAINWCFHFHQSLDKCVFCRCKNSSEFMNVYVLFDTLET